MSTVGVYHTEIRRRMRHEVDVFADHPAKHLVCVGDQVVQAEHRRRKDLLPGEGEQLAGQPRRALTGMVDLEQVGADRMVWREVVQGKLRFPHDHG
jgi:hypothetical protein